VYVGDSGFDIVVNFTSGGNNFDVSGATTRNIFLHNPDGEKITKSAVLSGTFGIKYLVEDGVIDRAGIWRIHGQADDLISLIDIMEVHPVI